jgi:hypothetical protein
VYVYSRLDYCTGLRRLGSCSCESLLPSGHGGRDRRSVDMSSFMRASKGEMNFPGCDPSIALSRRVASFAVFLLRFVGFAVRALLAMVLCIICLYLVVSSPPLHLYYPVADPAGPSSIYVPGSLEWVTNCPSIHVRSDYEFHTCFLLPIVSPSSIRFRFFRFLVSSRLLASSS